MTQQQYQAQPQAATVLPTPPMGPPSPTGNGGAPATNLQDYEVAFLGDFLKSTVKTLAPIALNIIKERVDDLSAASGGAQVSEAQVQQAADEYSAQWASLIPTLLPIGIELVKSLVQVAADGQAAGAGPQSSGDAGGNGAATAGVAEYTRG